MAVVARKAHGACIEVNGRRKKITKRDENLLIFRRDLSTSQECIGFPDLSGVDLVQTQSFPIDNDKKPRKRRRGECWQDLVIRASPYGRNVAPVPEQPTITVQEVVARKILKLREKLGINAVDLLPASVALEYEKSASPSGGDAVENDDEYFSFERIGYCVDVAGWKTETENMLNLLGSNADGAHDYPMTELKRKSRRRCRDQPAEAAIAMTSSIQNPGGEGHGTYRLPEYCHYAPWPRPRPSAADVAKAQARRQARLEQGAPTAADARAEMEEKVSTSLVDVLPQEYCRDAKAPQSREGARGNREVNLQQPLATSKTRGHAQSTSDGIRTGSPPTLSGVISVCAAIGTSVDQSSASGSRTPSRPRSPQPGVSVREHGAPATAPICGRAGDVSGRARRRLAAFLHVNTPSAKRDVAAAPTSPAVSPTASSAANQPATRSQNVREPCGSAGHAYGLGGDELVSVAPSRSMAANFIALLERSLGRGVWADQVASAFARPLDAILAYLPPEGAQLHRESGPFFNPPDGDALLRRSALPRVGDEKTPTFLFEDDKARSGIEAERKGESRTAKRVFRMPAGARSEERAAFPGGERGNRVSLTLTMHNGAAMEAPRAVWLERVAAVMEAKGDQDEAVRLYGIAAAALTGDASSDCNRRIDDGPAGNEKATRHGAGDGKSSNSRPTIFTPSRGDGSNLFPYSARAHHLASTIERAYRRHFRRRADAQTRTAAAFRGYSARATARQEHKRKNSASSFIARLWGRYLSRRALAALLVQAIARGHFGRRKCRDLRIAIECAIVVQSGVRMFLAKNTAERMRLEEAAAKLLQALQRGYILRRVRAEAIGGIQSELWQAARGLNRVGRGFIHRRFTGMVKQFAVDSEIKRAEAEAAVVQGAVRMASARVDMYLMTDAGRAELAYETRRARAISTRAKNVRRTASRAERRRASAHDVFDSFDLDGSGTIDVRGIAERRRRSNSELKPLLRALGTRMTEADLKVAFASLDADGSGDITFSEFYAWFDGESADDAGGVGDTFDALAGVASDVGSGGYATSHEGSPRPSVGRHLVNSSPTFSVMSGEGQETRGVSNVGRPSGIGKRKTLLSKISQVHRHAKAAIGITLQERARRGVQRRWVSLAAREAQVRFREGQPAPLECCVCHQAFALYGAYWQHFGGGSASGADLMCRKRGGRGRLFSDPKVSGGELRRQKASERQWTRSLDEKSCIETAGVKADAEEEARIITKGSSGARELSLLAERILVVRSCELRSGAWGGSIPSAQKTGVKIAALTFQAFDKDGNGTLDISDLAELLSVLKGVGKNVVTSGGVEAAMNEMDLDHSGQIDFREFLEWFEGNHTDAHRTGEMSGEANPYSHGGFHARPASGAKDEKGGTGTIIDSAGAFKRRHVVPGLGRKRRKRRQDEREDRDCKRNVRLVEVRSVDSKIKGDRRKEVEAVHEGDVVGDGTDSTDGGDHSRHNTTTGTSENSSGNHSSSSQPSIKASITDSGRDIASLPSLKASETKGEDVGCPRARGHNNVKPLAAGGDSTTAKRWWRKRPSSMVADAASRRKRPRHNHDSEDQSVVAVGDRHDGAMLPTPRERLSTDPWKKYSKALAALSKQEAKMLLLRRARLRAQVTELDRFRATRPPEPHEWSSPDFVEKHRQSLVDISQHEDNNAFVETLHRNLRDAEDAIRNLNSARTHPSCQRDDHATATVAAAPSATTICTPMQEASCANSEGWRSVDPAHPAPSFGQAGDDGSKDNDGGEKRSGGGNVASSLFAAFRGWGKEGWRTRGRHAQEFSGTHVSGAVNALTTTNEAGRAGFLEIVKAAENDAAEACRRALQTPTGKAEVELSARSLRAQSAVRTVAPTSSTAAKAVEAANTSATAGPAATDNGMRTVATEENMAASGGSERAEAELVNEALQLFDLFDADGSGALDHEELTPLLRELGVFTSTRMENDAKKKQNVFPQMDLDCSGSVRREEFASWVKKEGAASRRTIRSRLLRAGQATRARGSSSRRLENQIRRSKTSNARAIARAEVWAMLLNVPPRQATTTPTRRAAEAAAEKSIYQATGRDVFRTVLPKISSDMDLGGNSGGAGAQSEGADVLEVEAEAGGVRAEERTRSKQDQAMVAMNGPHIFNAPSALKIPKNLRDGLSHNGSGEYAVVSAVAGQKRGRALAERARERRQRAEEHANTAERYLLLRKAEDEAERRLKRRWRTTDGKAELRREAHRIIGAEKALHMTMRAIDETATGDGKTWGASETKSVLRSWREEEKIRHLFRLFDVSCDGSIDAEELSRLLRHLRVGRPESDVGALLRRMDRDGSGSVSFVEFSAWWHKEGRKQARRPAAIARRALVAAVCAVVPTIAVRRDARCVLVSSARAEARAEVKRTLRIEGEAARSPSAMPNALEMTTKSTKFVVNATAAPVTTPVPLPNERGTNTAVAGSTDARPLHGCTTDDDVLDCFGDDDDDDDGGVTRRVEDSQHLVAARALKLARAEAEAYADVQATIRTPYGKRELGRRAHALRLDWNATLKAAVSAARVRKLSAEVTATTSPFNASTSSEPIELPFLRFLCRVHDATSTFTAGNIVEPASTSIFGGALEPSELKYLGGTLNKLLGSQRKATNGQTALLQSMLAFRETTRKISNRCLEKNGHDGHDALTSRDIFGDNTSAEICGLKTLARVDFEDLALSLSRTRTTQRKDPATSGTNSRSSKAEDTGVRGQQHQESVEVVETEAGRRKSLLEVVSDLATVTRLRLGMFLTLGAFRALAMETMLAEGRAFERQELARSIAEEDGEPWILAESAGLVVPASTGGIPSADVDRLRATTAGAAKLARALAQGEDLAASECSSFLRTSAGRQEAHIAKSDAKERRRRLTSTAAASSHSPGLRGSIRLTSLSSLKSAIEDLGREELRRAFVLCEADSVPGEISRAEAARVLQCAGISQSTVARTGRVRVLPSGEYSQRVRARNLKPLRWRNPLTRKSRWKRRSQHGHSGPRRWRAIRESDAVPASLPTHTTTSLSQLLHRLPRNLADTANIRKRGKTVQRQDSAKICPMINDCDAGTGVKSERSYGGGIDGNKGELHVKEPCRVMTEDSDHHRLEAEGKGTRDQEGEETEKDKQSSCCDADSIDGAFSVDVDLVDDVTCDEGFELGEMEILLKAMQGQQTRLARTACALRLLARRALPTTLAETRDARALLMSRARTRGREKALSAFENLLRIRSDESHDTKEHEPNAVVTGGESKF